MTLLGIDVSHHQVAPNFGAIKAAGNSFVFIKATEGVGYTDPAFVAMRAGARAAGLTVGFYHFARAGDPIAEADYFCSVVGALHTGDLVVLDWETTTAKPPAWCKTWLDRAAAKLGVKPLIYMNQSTRDGHDWSPVVAGNYGLWLAAYDGTTAVPNSGKWPNVAFKQFTSSGTVPGVSGAVDRNVFFGTAAALAKYGKQPAPTPPPAPPPAPVPTPTPPLLPGETLTPADIDAIATAVAAKVRADQFTIIEGPKKGTKIAGQTALRDVLAAVTAIRNKLGA